MNYVNNVNIDDLILVPAQTTTEQSSGKLPTQVYLTIDYYQVTQYYKRIIFSTVAYSQWLAPNDTQANGTAPFNYTLHINFHSMDHTELVIKFAFDWTVYFILFLIIGIFSVGEYIVMYIYKYITNRKSPRPSPRFYSYLFIFVPIIKGMVIACTVLSVPIGLVSVIMLGSFWRIPMPLQSGCTGLTTEC